MQCGMALSVLEFVIEEEVVCELVTFEEINCTHVNVSNKCIILPYNRLSLQKLKQSPQNKQNN